jgi:hypothetical protein
MSEGADGVEMWLRDWCREELGAAPAERLMAASLMSEVTGLRLEDGREVVVKRRPDPTGRVATCLAVQEAVAAVGLPCSRPLTGAKMAAGFAVHAEEWRPGGEIDSGTDVEAAERSARLYAAVTRVTSRLEFPPPLPNPEWVRWDHDGPGHWPPNELHDHRPAADSLPNDLVAIAGRARKRLVASKLPHVLGHADWEAQNLRWNGSEPHVVHDWDSVAWLPEAALAGAAAGAFASNETPTLAPLASSEAFLDAYQDERGAAFTRDELEIAWAASLWTALHNGRAEILWNHPPVALAALLDQAEARLRRAAA